MCYPKSIKWLQNFAYRIEMSWPREIEIRVFETVGTGSSLRILFFLKRYFYLTGLVDVFPGRRNRIDDCIIDGKLAGDSRGEGESGGELEV